MNVDESKKKEEMSIAYLSALCASGGISFDLQRHDDDSTDAIIKKLVNLDDSRKCESILRVQLKSTSSQYKEDRETLVYPLKVKNYNDLRAKATTPIILALFILPEKTCDWLKWTEEELMLRGKMYWANLSNAPETTNSQKISVVIEKRNIVNTETLLEILKKIAEEA